jgi:hypothetical protein
MFNNSNNSEIYTGAASESLSAFTAEIAADEKKRADDSIAAANKRADDAIAFEKKRANDAIAASIAVSECALIITFFSRL